MSNYSLTPTPALEGYDKSFGSLYLKEMSNIALISIAVPNQENALANLNAALKKAYGLSFPEAGKGEKSSDNQYTILSMSPDQAFLMFDYEGIDADILVKNKLGEAGYYTLQSDVWVALKLSGEKVRAPLARICQLDLHPDHFQVGDVASTLMEHMRVIIYQEDEDSFILMTSRSYARSFLHAIEMSINFSLVGR